MAGVTKKQASGRNCRGLESQPAAARLPVRVEEDEQVPLAS